MARGTLRTSRWLRSLVLGSAGALVVLAAHLRGLDDRAELEALDLRFRCCSNAPEPDNILHVDIDDRSLSELGRWPWPRQRLAGIIEVLRECGARAIVLDIIMPEPQKVRYVSREREVYRSYGQAVTHDVPPVPVFDDAVLASAIVRSGKVFLPGHLDFGGQDQLVGLRGLIGEILARQPSAPLTAVYAEITSGRNGSPTETVAKAYLDARAAAAMKRFSIAPGRVTGYPLKGGRLVPPLVTFAEAVHGTGFVTFVPDEGGVMRRIHLLGRSGRTVYPQFAFALAMAELGRRHGGSARITADASGVTIRCADGVQRGIPVDSSGAMLINWSRPTWGTPAKRVSAAAVDYVSQGKTDLEQRGDLAYVLRVKLIQMGREMPEDVKDLYWEAVRYIKALDQAYLERIAQQRHICRDALYRPGRRAGVAEIARLSRNEREAREKAWAVAERAVAEIRKSGNLDVFLGRPAAAPEGGEAPVEHRQAVARFSKSKAEAERILKQLDAVPAGTEQLRKNVAKSTKDLARIVTGKICMIGSTATGAADFVPTPLWPRTPGVVVHSNILNTILSGAFLTQAPMIVNILVILAAGILVSLVAATRPVLQAAPVAACLAVAYAAFNVLVVFHVWSVWLALVAPLGAMLASFLVVTAYRQLTEERAKRHIKGLFAHAMSPALVERLLEDPSLAELGGQERNLSCFFSDLAGFTALSESLGPQETVRLLNRYFDRITQVIQERCGGYLNKFLGDGIFAFFGAPVLQDDHARRAIQAAVACQAEVAELNEALAGEEGRNVRLSVRIGITTGEAMVGNCGSTHRMDYTAIGDCVNLASRLETANKFFGTGILVDEASWRTAGAAGLPARPLGKVLVAGRGEPASVWEIRHGPDADAPQLQAALVDFTQALGLLAERKFAAAAESFEKVHKLMPEDKATQIYLEVCREYSVRPPDEAWAGHVIDVSSEK